MEIISREDALAQGLKWYFTGNPCKNGHIIDRIVSNKRCRECSRIKCYQQYQKIKNTNLQKIINELSVDQQTRIISRRKSRELGLSHYFTGKLCNKGHRAERMVSSRSCVECKRINEQYWKKNNIEHSRIKRLEAYYQNHAHNLQLSKQKRERNIGSYRERCRLYLKSHPAIRNAHRAKHDAAKQSATPLWLSRDHFIQIIQFYREAVDLKKTTGRRHHVDHIHPLTNPHICGLHVPWNLQVLLAEDNIRKHNKFEPYFVSAEELKEVEQRFLLLIVNISHETDPD